MDLLLAYALLQPDWVNGTMVWSDSKNKVGKIVCLSGVGAPYQTRLLKEVEAGAIAVVIYRDRSDTPGLGMFYTRMGFDESKLNIPVIEAYESFSEPESLHNFRSRMPPGGIEVTIHPEENKWKTMNDRSGVQVFFNLLHSFMEIAILTIAAHRLSLWIRFSSSGLVSIGPVCIALESIAAALRLANTCVDPFVSFRTMPTPFSEILFTAYLPFQFSAGILLTFFWAETLTSHKVQAVPFISEYKVSCFIAITILFLGEIISSTIRSIYPVTSFNPIYICEAFYVIVAIILTVCYLLCATQISERLRRARSSKQHIRWLSFRFALSTGGYIIFIILVILLIPFFGTPWGFKLIFNLVYVCSNTTAILQVWVFVPPSYTKSSKSTGGTGTPNLNEGGSTLELVTHSKRPSSDPEADHPPHVYMH